MFCPNCGSQVEEGTKFCEHCGAQLAQKTTAGAAPQAEANVGGPQAAFQALPKKPIPKQAIVAAAAAVVILAAGGFVYSKISNTLNLNKYITVSFEGYDGYGKAYTEFDYDKLYKDWGKKLKIKDKTVKKAYEKMANQYDDYLDDDSDEMNYKNSAGYMVLLAGIDGAYSLDERSQLTNGDEVKLSWDIEDVYLVNSKKSVEDVLGIKIKSKEKDFKVEGLEKVETFDAFANVEVKFSGIAPNGQAEIIDNNDTKLNISCSKKSGLSEGDVITLTIPDYDISDIVDSCGGVPAEMEKEYTVTGLDSYVQSIASISEDTMNQMITQGENILRAKAASDWNSEKNLLSVAYQGCYLLKARYPEQVRVQNELGLVYQMTANVTREDFSQDITYYCFIGFEDLLNDGDGVTTVDMSDYNMSRSYVELSQGWWSWTFYGSQTLDDLKNELVTANLDNYDYEESFAQ